MRLVLTRPKKDGERLARKLRRFGHQVWLAPMLTINVFDRVDWPNFTPDILAATSANGVLALIAHAASFRQATGVRVQTLPLFAVGQQTARAAKRAGWQTIHTGQGDVNSLANQMKHVSQQAEIWHISGEDQAGDLVKQLSAHGRQARRVKLYEAVQAQYLPKRVVNRLTAADGFVLYSVRSAQAFIACLNGRHLSATAFCLSSKVADVMAAQGFATAIAEAPNDDAICRLINRYDN